MNSDQQLRKYHYMNHRESKIHVLMCFWFMDCASDYVHHHAVIVAILGDPFQPRVRILQVKKSLV